MLRVRMRRFLSLVVASIVLAVPALAIAAPRLDVAHVQGRDAPWVVGWNEAVVALDNVDGAAWRGEVLIDSSYDRHPDSRGSVRVPVSLSAGESVRLLIPFHLHAGTFPNVILRTTGEGEASSTALTLTRGIEGVATIVEIQGKEARGPKLVDVPASSSFDDEKEDSGAPIAPPHPPHFGPKHGGPVPVPAVPPSGYTSLAVAQVSTVQMARESGDPILPDIAGGWSGAVLVLAPSDILARLQGRSLDALEHWVLAGGTIAIAVTREEDLRSAPLKQLIGGEARVTSGAGSSTMSFSGGNLARGDVTKEGDDGDVTNHGLGQVWLLRRDPWARTFDPKSPKTIYGLWHTAKARRATTISLPAGTGLRFQDDERVRKFIDPNHGFRPSLGIAAVLLVIYALLVGPVAFARARKLGQPLSVLRITPLLALGLFTLLVGLGKIGKGFRGRARRLQVLEVAGGATKGSTTTFHAFYVADPNVVEVVASRPIDTVHVVEPFSEGDPIELDRGSIAVRAVRAHPWQTIVVAEEGMRDVGGGIILEGNGQRLTLVNKTTWTLEHVVLHPETIAAAPARSRYFAKVAPGETVVARDGVAVDRRVRPLPYHFVAGGGGGEPLIKNDDPSSDAIDALDALVSAWSGSSYPAGEPVPFQLPMATALVRTSGGQSSGLNIEREAILIRVLGLGGGKGKGELEQEPPKGKEQAL
jgi:hypothetical protein